ncbi:MAG TPA: hypothetical protein DCO90_10625 [Sphingobacterium sp.]|nr:hypothetical protein [Sphingobacterium sp.]
MIRQNGNARIYNSVIEGFSQYGLLFDDATIVAKTKTGADQLIFSHNSIENIGLLAYHYIIPPFSTWVSVGGCNFYPSDVMKDWIEGLTPAACKQSGNQFGFGTTGYYQSTLCGNDKCTNFPNLYINTSTTLLDDPDYSELSGFFNQPTYRGALQSSTDTWLKSSWLDFCPARNYCQ